jgi:hypothetical protein
MKMWPMHFIPILLAATLGAACKPSANIVTGGETASPRAGTWVQRDAVVGTSFVLALEVQDSRVTGTGTYFVEGGRSGTLTEIGAISGGMLRLDITFDYGALAQFAGRQVNAVELSGSLHFGPPQSLTPSYPVTFDKRD